MNWRTTGQCFAKYRHALVHHECEQGEPGTDHGAELSVFDHGFHSGGRVPSCRSQTAGTTVRDRQANWLTKQTELAYYNFCADESFRQNFFLEKFERVSWWERHQGKDQLLAAVQKKNPSFINEPVYAKRLEDEADKSEQYAVGRLIVAGRQPLSFR